MNKIRTIIGKEWSEVFKTRMVLLSVVLLPLILAIIPLGMLVAFNRFGESMGNMSDPDVMAAFATQCQGLSGADCTVLYTLNLFVLMFMILPVMIPITIAAYSIVGEKANRSLEPLLATPITTAELLTGKILAAVLPAILATWAAFLLFFVGAYFLASPAVFDKFLDPLWLIAILFVAPLLTMTSACIALIISSRASDPRVAEQLSALVLLPIILVVIGQSLGLVLINRQLMLLILVIVVLADAALLYLAVRLFQRETILTRWR